MYTVVSSKINLGTYATKEYARKAIQRACKSGKYPGVDCWWMIQHGPETDLYRGEEE
jgi:hypothetical protein